MTTVGVRELRQRASELLRLVRRGETIQITDRGELVAVLAPVPQGSALERLRAAGDLTTAIADLDDLPAPLALGQSQRAPSENLARLRADER